MEAARSSCAAAACASKRSDSVIRPAFRVAIVMDRGRIVHDGPSEALERDGTRLDALIGVAKR